MTALPLDPSTADMETHWGFETKAIHVGQGADPTTGATVVPIYQTSTYTQQAIAQHKGYEYSRTGNPTRTALEACLASLEEARYGLAFASGLAATSAVLSLLRPGDNVVAMNDMYGGTYRLFEKVAAPMGITFAYVDGTDATAFNAALTPATKLVWIETPTNPLMRLVDIAAVASACKAANALLVVDNTFASPYFQKPLTLGADLVLHSTTKYIGGHSDVVGGAILTNHQPSYEALKFYQNAAGGVPGAMDAWLTLRGVKTLALRMERHASNAMLLAEALEKHPKVHAVHYPGLASFPQAALAKRQMSGFSGMLTLELKGGFDEANRFLQALTLFSLAESLGGVESLACYPARMTHGAIPEAERKARGFTEGLVRLSVGVETPADLLADVLNALEQL